MVSLTFKNRVILISITFKKLKIIEVI